MTCGAAYKNGTKVCALKAGHKGHRHRDAAHAEAQKAASRKYRQSEKHRETQRRYRQSEKGTEVRRREARRRYHERSSGPCLRKGCTEPRLQWSSGMYAAYCDVHVAMQQFKQSLRRSNA